METLRAEREALNREMKAGNLADLRSATARSRVGAGAKVRASAHYSPGPRLQSGSTLVWHLAKLWQIWEGFAADEAMLLLVAAPGTIIVSVCLGGLPWLALMPTGKT